MQYLGETISLGVAMMWTGTALVSEMGSKRIGVVNFNMWRMTIAMVASFALVWCMSGVCGVPYAGLKTWLWMALSGFVGFYLCDFCLFKCYVYISSRYGQLFMTLAPAAAALAAWLSLGQTMTWGNVLAMGITLSGIAITVLSREDTGEGKKKLQLTLPWRGIAYGIGAGVGQGLGLVLSKIGMDYYEADIPADAIGQMHGIIPFSANAIRCVAGFACCAFTVAMRRSRHDWLASGTDGKAMSMTLLAVIFGPFLGVGFSLMAVQYAKVGIAQTLMALTPILIILPSWWLFRQPVTAKGIFGAIVSVIGASLFFLL